MCNDRMSNAQIFCVIPIAGAPEHVQATLRTVSWTDMLDQIHFHFCITQNEEIESGEVLALANKYGLTPHTQEQIDRVAVPKLGIMGWAYAFCRGLCAFAGGQWPWFLWLDSDFIVNPDWLSRLLDIEMRAARCAKHDPRLRRQPIGAISAIRLRGKKAYTDIPAPGEGDFFFRDCVNAGSILMRRDVVSAIDHTLFAQPILLPDGQMLAHDPFMMRDLRQQGYIHVVPRDSVAQHIGREGMTSKNRKWVYRGRGGIGFVPHPRVRPLWEAFNQDIVNTPRDPGTLNIGDVDHGSKK